MNIHDLILRNRSYRRFDESKKVEVSVLRSLIDLGRLSPSGANIQPLKYVISVDPEKNGKIFPHLLWAGYLKDWEGPEPGERPSAYMLLLRDGAISKTSGVDHGIAAQSILLGAVNAGMGGCMIGAIKRESLAAALKIPDRFEILLVIALGYPVETVVLEEVDETGRIEYYREADGTHHVPKRSLDDIILDY